MTGVPRVVVVAGASSGIGRATALRAADRGDHLVLVARGANALEDTARECRAGGAASVLVVPTDIGDDAAVASCFDTVRGHHDRVDAVVNAAGVVAYGRTEQVPPEIFEGVLRANLTGAVNVARHALPFLRQQEAGTLVLVGSVIGHIAVPSMSPYVISKWGVRALARQLAVENRDLRDVHIVYVAPGGVDTPIYLQAANYDGHVGRPPPPVLSPERVAKVVLARLDHPRPRTQVGWSNQVMRFGFTAMPMVFDVLVGPLFRLAAIDRTSPVGCTEGNVLAPREDGNRLHGRQGSAVAGIVRNLATQVKAATGRAA